MHELQRQSKIVEISNQRIEESIADLSLLRFKYFEGCEIMTEEKKKLITLRIEKSLLSRIDEKAKKQKIDRSQILRELLNTSLRSIPNLKLDIKNKYFETENIVYNQFIQDNHLKSVWEEWLLNKLELLRVAGIKTDTLSNLELWVKKRNETLETVCKLCTKFDIFIDDLRKEGLK